MIETNLIADSNIREGLKSYLEKQKQAPTEVPQFKSATVSALPGVVVPATQERFGFTDFDVFICDAAWANEQAQALVRSVVETLAKAGRVGQIRLKKWSFYDEVPLVKLRNKLTIIIDKDHGETAELPRLERQLQGVSGISEIQVVDNSGRATTWLISVITCPSM